MSFLSNIVKSVGLKRRISSLVNVLLGVIRTIPQLQFLVLPLEAFSASVGGVGLIHAAEQGTVKKAKLLSLSSILSLLVIATHYGVTHNNPALAAFYPIVSLLSSLAGAGGVGVSAGVKNSGGVSSEESSSES